MRSKLTKAIGRAIFATFARIEGVFFDRFLLSTDVPRNVETAHCMWPDYLEKIGNQPGTSILEVGSREVAGPSDARKRFCKADYVGFDFYPGRNVDVVGDAHKLSSYFPPNERFDLIYSEACFEHFAMPWVVAQEIAKMLKVNGIVFIETHFSFSSHERPWNFFQFSDMGLRVLFSPALGFECIEAGMSSPIAGRFSRFAEKYCRYQPVKGLYAHSGYLGKKIREVEEFSWQEVDLSQVVGNTVYPPKQE
jgi:SAM-dependent methyltransferase